MASNNAPVLEVLGTQLARLAAALAAAGMLFAGCGDGRTSGGAETDRSITKAAFIEQGDAICAAAEKRVAAKSAKLLSEGGQGSAHDLLGILVRSIPDYQVMIDDMRALGVPEGDEDQVEAMFDAMQRRIDWIRESPGDFAREDRAAQAQYEEMLAMVKGYGFRKCYQ